MAQHHIRLDWASMDGERTYTEISTFTPKLVNGKPHMVIYSVKLSADGIILWGGPRSWSAHRTLPVEKARKVYRDCLKRGYKSVEAVPQGRHFDQVAA